MSKIELDRMMAEMNQMMLDSWKALFDKMEENFALLVQQTQRRSKSHRNSSPSSSVEESLSSFDRNMEHMRW